jgi:hypothetical protein
MAAQVRRSKTGALEAARQAWRKATRCPARFPLSTVEMYPGARSSRVFRSYQLRKCPRNRRSFASVSNTRSNRVAVSSRSMKPRSWALTVASSCSPMLVGEVRIATTGAGLSWKLSGASQWVRSVTKRSKKLQWSRA